MSILIKLVGRQLATSETWQNHNRTENLGGSGLIVQMCGINT